MLFGTGQGLSQSLIERCDYLLLPIDGFSEFNHLSVRSAVAIVLDRWLGVNQQMVRDMLKE
jgi:tRNA (guanine37-N1)-methyltransferase